MLEDDFALQATIFGRYLLRVTPTAAAQDLFVTFMRLEAHKLTPRDRKLLRFVLKHSWSLGLIDAGLALTDPTSEVRRRLYVMFGILECQPEYHDYFLPKKRSWWYAFFVLYAGARSLLKAGLGVLVVKAAG